ncbi:iron-sulfur cluster insertion protein ErpA [Marivibrio halodurans]|uniref:Iron-sulfur cluster insertion protein ErpA n=1 Tax=Marivibrio halodurans TaxID=2039722 RepID=A0A8J7S2Z5_9PROT|nr:iron-sulfur cluster insertion protein ErpA [Marivibrio halodurans]MBP5855744.1 iron-sulfur cluster insertion protein ErpA [Marivibrio halodurans]
MNDGPRELSISDAAARRLAFLLGQEDDPDQMLRVTVSGGGCSGYQYHFDFDREARADDLVFERDGVKVVTDNASMDLLAGSQLDYVDDLIGAFFTVNNPNASSSCGCGVSFSA